MTSAEFEFTGGATYGVMNATWPFAALRVNKNELELNISLLGNLHFRPEDVVSITKSGMSFFSNGIRIKHKVKGYYSTVIFKSFTNADSILQQIQQTGFLDNKVPLPHYDDTVITSMQEKGGFTMKIPAAIAIVVIWNLLFLPNFVHSFQNNKVPFIGMHLGLSFMLLLSLTLLISEPFRDLLLKEGRTLKHIKTFVLFMILISALILGISFLLPQF
ncbi:hypothetical protein SAMN05421821_105108 [Mucilaginibacter lappiensis]|uniref:Uncharacterized protein n=1 Tax=Mucilaginibacter lappiensis TaxID=354630 RepID=A0ABR6PIY2_9SPHI|nr:hypothetical protein [Mucilaginibacter lappiensis]MBB6109690.1 hypothetical protein [Mucilaginibacter lappiensis]SIR11918.1 hypothetical protein SAMN05421821_105108 [Mucilaginibacter lappiensis]